jgi:hypothetical protein
VCSSQNVVWGWYPVRLGRLQPLRVQRRFLWPRWISYWLVINSDSDGWFTVLTNNSI